ncbi:hypothetical protein [Arachnia propionica]|uniref:Uncharacterized protein n=1 Tax=Arachnia propionica TaxID=1750 RepID=A0A3P1X044_9ACTN|nr:hypothetical protein [Arachnia propionica]RRD50063.1 hypothetical protein EII35_05750 [Arachnia propionica]
MVWPETFGRRFMFATAVYQPAAFISSLLVGWFKQLPLAVTMLEVWLLAFIIALVISLAQAAAARPGVSVWKPLLPVSEEEFRRS